MSAELAVPVAHHAPWHGRTTAPTRTRRWYLREPNLRDESHDPVPERRREIDGQLDTRRHLSPTCRKPGSHHPWTGRQFCRRCSPLLGPDAYRTLKVSADVSTGGTAGGSAAPT